MDPRGPYIPASSVYAAVQAQNQIQNLKNQKNKYKKNSKLHANRFNFIFFLSTQLRTAETEGGGMWKENVLLLSYLFSLIKIWKANVEILYSLVLASPNRKQPVDIYWA